MPSRRNSSATEISQKVKVAQSLRVIIGIGLFLIGGSILAARICSAPAVMRG